MSFSIWTFTAGEIKQIVALAKSICAGALRFDLRKMSKNVRDYVIRWGILRREGKTIVPNPSLTWRDFPIAAVWELILPAFNGEHSKGRSIARSAVWLDLNIWPEGNSHHGARDYEEQIELLIRLQSYGYLWALFGGSVWDISITPEYRELSQ